MPQCKKWQCKIHGGYCQVLGQQRQLLLSGNETLSISILFIGALDENIVSCKMDFAV